LPGKTLVLQHLRFGIAGAIERCVDHLQHAFGILNDVVVPETDDAVALGLEPARPRLVASFVGLITVLRAIDLDDEARGHAGEVDDIGADWRLSPEMRSFDR